MAGNNLQVFSLSPSVLARYGEFIYAYSAVFVEIKIYLYMRCNGYFSVCLLFFGYFRLFLFSLFSREWILLNTWLIIII